MHSRTLKIQDLMDLFCASKSTVNRLYKKGVLPRKRKLGSSGRAVGWPEHEIYDWLNSYRKRPYRCDRPQMVRLPEVEKLSGIAKSTIYRERDAGTFPQGVKLDPEGRARFWFEDEVIEWRNQQPRDTSQSHHAQIGGSNDDVQ